MYNQIVKGKAGSDSDGWNEDGDDNDDGSDKYQLLEILAIVLATIFGVAAKAFIAYKVMLHITSGTIKECCRG